MSERYVFISYGSIVYGEGGNKSFLLVLTLGFCSITEVFLLLGRGIH